MTDSNGLYYMRARYYNPGIKRFMNQDILLGSVDETQSLNRYAYVNGNPVSYVDPFGLSALDSDYQGTGNLVQKSVSAVKKGWNYVNSEEFAYQAGEVLTGGAELNAAAEILGPPAKGAGKAVLSKIPSSVMNRVESVSFDINLQLFAKDSSLSKLVNGVKMKTNQALDAAEEFLGAGYKDLGNGRFGSANGSRQVRMGDTDILGQHGGGPHMNFETLILNPAKPGKMMPGNNIHVYLED